MQLIKFLHYPNLTKKNSVFLHQGYHWAFSNRVVNRWNLLDQRTVDAPRMNAFNNVLSRIRDNRMGFFKVR